MGLKGPSRGVLICRDGVKIHSKDWEVAGYYSSVRHLRNLDSKYLVLCLVLQ